MIDSRTVACLKGVHPDLVKVVMAAYSASAVPFVVIQGLRTVAQEQANVAKGASQTMHSRHLPNAQGLACAVDVMARPKGKPSWNPIDYQPIAAAMLDCAHELGVLVEWGGDWKTLKDWGHFQLPWAAYPWSGERQPHLTLAAADGHNAPPAAPPPAGASHV